MRNTKRCRYCWDSGHNVRTCPKAKKDAANNVSYRAKAIVAKAQTTASRTKVCSYCRQSGHNVQTCAKQSQDDSARRLNLSNYRKAFVEWAKTNSFGIGTLLRLANHEIAFVVGFDPTVLIDHDWVICKLLNNQKLYIEAPKAFRMSFNPNSYIWSDYTIAATTEMAYLPSYMKDNDWQCARESSLTLTQLRTVRL